jgi:hypothetical protein
MAREEAAEQETLHPTPPIDDDATPVLGVPVVPAAPVSAQVPVADDDDDPDADRSALVLMMAGRGPLSSAQVADVLGIDQQQARGMLNSLAEDGRLERVGRTTGTRYVVPGAADV